MTEPYGPKNRSPKQKDVDDFHKYDDINISATAHHHTIGGSLHQAASGSHQHTGGEDSPQLLDGTILIGAKAAYNAALMAQICTALAALGAADNTT